MIQHATVIPHRSLATAFFIAAQLGASFAAAADATPPPASDPTVEAQATLDAWPTQGQPACAAKTPECSKHIEAMYNAAMAFQAAGQRNKAIAVRTLLVQPNVHIETTGLAKKVHFQLAEDHKALTEYARAAELFEGAAAKFPTADEAPDALMDATVFRLTLGEFEQATKNAEQFDKVYGAKKPTQAVTMWLAIAATLADSSRFKEAKAILNQVMSRVDNVGDARDKIAGHALLGRAFAGLADTKGAEKEYATVRALWKNAEMQKKIMADVDANPRNVGRILTYVGEAVFFFAEQKRKDVEAIKFPEYKGPGEMPEVLKHINTKVVDWIKKKKPAIEETEKAYQQVMELQPAPPPRWVIASASRVGGMWGKFVAEFRAGPIPKEWRQNGPVPGVQDLTYQELRNDYYARIDEAAEPQKQRAKAAFKMCVDFSVKYQYTDEFSQACQNWLEKNYRKEFIHVAEIIPALRLPTLTSDQPALLPDPRPAK